MDNKKLQTDEKFQCLYQSKRSILNKIYSKVERYASGIRWKNSLKEFGSNSYIQNPAYIHGGKGIKIGNNVTIWRNSRIEARKDPEQGIAINIGDGCKIHPYVHIGAVENVSIGVGCLFASNVYVTDHDHDFSDPFNEVISNRRVIVSSVSIGEYVWLGEGVMVLKGSRIGARSIIGAGSIVTGSIPDLSIAIGRPARVIKKYDVNASAWVSV